MLSRWYAQFVRSVLVAVLLALSVMAVPQPVLSAPMAKVELEVKIAAVVRGESVSVRAVGFPARTSFTVRIGDPDKLAQNGEVVAEFTTDTGGTFDATYALPEAMRENRFLGIRFDGDGGYYAYAWFINSTRSGLVEEEALAQPELIFADVVKNGTVTIEASGLAPNTGYRVRVGPYETFFRDYVVLGTQTSDEQGKIQAELALPEAVADAEYITVRLDAYSFRIDNHQRTVISTFSNQDGGAFVPASSLIKVVPCTVINTRALPNMRPGQDFDAVWTVKNTGNYDWDAGTVLYHFYSGSRTYKFESSYHITFEVPRGYAFPITVDMTAPETPGWYSTTWELTQDNRTLCRMGAVFFVKGDD